MDPISPFNEAVEFALESAIAVRMPCDKQIAGTCYATGCCPTESGSVVQAARRGIGIQKGACRAEGEPLKNRVGASTVSLSDVAGWRKPIICWASVQNQSSPIIQRAQALDGFVTLREVEAILPIPGAGLVLLVGNGRNAVAFPRKDFAATPVKQQQGDLVSWEVTPCH